MGQYYDPTILDSNNKPVAWAYSHDFKEKCTNHKGEEFLIGTGLKLMEHSWIGNGFVNGFAALLTPGAKYYCMRVVWAGDYADPEEGTETNIYRLDTDDLKIKLRKKPNLHKTHPFIVNYNKSLYVDLNKVPDGKDDWAGWRIHPLPLLTCEGNGRGGGDYHGENDLIGSWARDHIGVEKEIPAGFNELIFDLTEDYE